MRSILSTAFVLATCVSGCAHHKKPAPASSVVKRAPAPYPPKLSADEAVLINSFDTTTIDQWSYYYTHGLHLAGRNFSMAKWTADKFREYGFTASIPAYDVFLNYPVSKSLLLSKKDGTTYKPSLEEEVLKVDPTTGYPNRVPTFHGYSWSGSASAEYVYVGLGQMGDFERLKELGVPLKGKIALAKYGGPFRGLKVKNSQEYGMIGCIIFTDPIDDGEVTIENGYLPYPKGPARNPSSVQRGSVEFLSIFPGDPTTPGYASKPGVPRQDTVDVTPRIPSIPVSYEDVIPILQALDGYGTPGEDVGRDGWVGALNATYSTGPARGTKLEMENKMRDRTREIWDAIGIINGTHQDEVIVIGNHRDAWIIGGAADPNSGTAVLVELSKAFGELLKTGWKPRRTIVLASWDGEEYGLLGSTEFVEEYIPWLSRSVVSYLNVDVAVSGPNVYFDATPELHRVSKNAMKKVRAPRVAKQTLYDFWLDVNGGDSVGVLGSGSDYTSFVHNGIGALDMGAYNGPEDPVYHYHSNYDSYHWMKTYGDPGFLTHKAVGQWLTLMTYHLASDPVTPFNVKNYAVQMQSYYRDLRKTIRMAKIDLDTSAIDDAIESFREAARAATMLQREARSTQKPALVDKVNRLFRDFSRGFVSQGGLPNREFFKHLVFAPGLDTGYAPVTFPYVTEAIDAGDLDTARVGVIKTAQAIRTAANILRP